MADQFNLRMNGIMHRAFLRDLGRVADQVASDRWDAARRRWRLVADLLHEHHRLEDEYLWPVMLAKISDTADLATVHAMEAEHEDLAAALSRCEEDFSGPPSEGVAARDAVMADLATLTDVLQRHCAHEEAGGEPLIQRYVTPEEFQLFLRQTRGGDLRMVVFPWAADGATPEDVVAIWGHLPRPVRIFLKPRMERAYRGRLAA